MGTSILIVDDEKNIRRTVRIVLEGEGYSVEEAGSGEEALARLPDIAPDVVLLDVQLPGISGHEVLESLRRGRAPAGAPEPVAVMISSRLMSPKPRVSNSGLARWSTRKSRTR